jgi:hypothetical protein
MMMTPVDDMTPDQQFAYRMAVLAAWDVVDALPMADFDRGNILAAIAALNPSTIDSH